MRLSSRAIKNDRAVGNEGDHFLSLITFVTKVINAIINNPNWIKSLNLTIENLLSANYRRNQCRKPGSLFQEDNRLPFMAMPHIYSSASAAVFHSINGTTKYIVSGQRYLCPLSRIAKEKEFIFSSALRKTHSHNMV